MPGIEVASKFVVAAALRSGPAICRVRHSLDGRRRHARTDHPRRLDQCQPRAWVAIGTFKFAGSLMCYPEKMGQPSIKVTIPGQAGRNSTITARAATMTTKQIANPPHRSRERGPAGEETGVASTATDTAMTWKATVTTSGTGRWAPAVARLWARPAGTREPAACSMGPSRSGRQRNADRSRPPHARTALDHRGRHYHL